MVLKYLKKINADQMPRKVLQHNEINEIYSKVVIIRIHKFVYYFKIAQTNFPCHIVPDFLFNSNLFSYEVESLQVSFLLVRTLAFNLSTVFNKFIYSSY